MVWRLPAGAPGVCFKPLQSGALVPSTAPAHGGGGKGVGFKPLQSGALVPSGSTVKWALRRPAVLNPFRAGHWCQELGNARDGHGEDRFKPLQSGALVPSRRPRSSPWPSRVLNPFRAGHWCQELGQRRHREVPSCFKPLQSGALVPSFCSWPCWPAPLGRFKPLQSGALVPSLLFCWP